MSSTVENVISTLGFEGGSPLGDMRALDEASRRSENDLMSRLDSAAAAPRFPSADEAIVPIPLPSPEPMGEEPPQSPTHEAREKKPTKEKPAAQWVSPGLRPLGTVLGKLLPGAERIRVHKRLPNGTKGYVGDYTADDLGNMDMETFLAKYAQSVHGSGEYALTGITGNGREIDAGVVTLLGPSTPVAPGNELTSIVQELIRKQDEKHKDMMKMMQQPQIPPPDPINLLNGVMEVQERVSKQARNETQGGLGSLGEAMAKQGESTMQMMMAMMQQQQQQAMAAQQQQMQLLTAMMQQPKTDPLLAALLQKVLEKPSDAGMANMPPPPPPAPSIDPMESLEKTIRVVAEIMKPREDQDRLSTRDIIELVRNPAAAVGGQDDFKRAADNMAVIMNLANSMKQQTEPGASAGFFDALASLFGNREFVGTLAGAARQKMLPPGASPAPQGQAQVPPQVVQAFRQLQAQVAQQNELLSRQAAELEALKRAVPAVVSQSTPPTAEAAPVVEPSKAPVTQPQELPQEVLDHLNVIEEAFRQNDEMKMLEETVNLLDTIEGIPGFWNQLASHILDAVEQKNKGQAVDYVKSFFEAMSRVGILGEGVGTKVVSLVDEHFDMLAEQILSDEQ